MLKKILVVVILLFLLIASHAGNGKKKPNIIFIITDDQPNNSYGRTNQKVEAPNINQLASEGVLFTQNYVPATVCTPSRYSCLTGRYPSRSDCEIFKNDTARYGGQTVVAWNARLAENDMTAPKVLQKNGYVTGYVGKWHLGDGNKVWRKIPTNADPQDPKIKAILSENQKSINETIKKFGGFDYVASACRGDVPKHCSGNKYLNYQHNMEWITKGGLDFIEANKDKPFCLYFCSTLVHGPDPLKALVHGDTRKYWGGTLEKPLDGIQPSRASVLERARKAGLVEKKDGKWQYCRGGYSSSLAAIWLDDAIGVLMRKLHDLKLDENTLIVFLTDQGVGVGTGKGSLYEPGIKVPMILRWTGTANPEKSTALVQSLDVVPTIFEACGITPPKDYTLDGVSLMPLLKGEKKQLRDSIYAEIGFARCVRRGKWKYIAFRRPPKLPRNLDISPEENRKRVENLHKYLKENKSKRGWWKRIPKDAQPLKPMLGPYKAYFMCLPQCCEPDQLYDLEKDPKEQNNLAGDPKYQKKLTEMKTILKSYLDRLPGTFGDLKPKD